LRGKVYLAGPYKTAPLSLAVVVPAVSGPYDVGNILVRAAISVDPRTAQISTSSDPLPLIFDGIPLRVREIQVNLDRPGFTLNPTNCDPFAVIASISGDEGAHSIRPAHFQVANCTNLPYRPKLRLKLSGGLRRRGHPAIRAVFSAHPGEANTRSVSVALPKGELLDQSHIRTVCTRVQFSANACPPGSLLGTVQATTPILEAPLKGNVYLRSSTNDLPDLAMDLEGQFDFELVARVDTAKGGALRTTIDTAPDVPVSSFVLNLVGGARGLLINSEDLCKAPKRATVRVTGQNGARLTSMPKLSANCRSKAESKRHHSHAADTRKSG
jgi:hypothetical protein